MTAECINDRFQETIINVFSKMNTCRVQAAPLKKIARCQEKAESEYNKETFPTTAKILDFVRCSVTFNNAKDMLDGLKYFETIVNSGNTPLKGIVRIKNGFENLNLDYPNYADIKLNVCVHFPGFSAMIVEVM